MSMRERLSEDLKSAMKTGDTLRVSVIRLAMSEMRNTEISKGRARTEEESLEVFTREGKKRREAIEQYEKAGRADLSEKESAELRILEEYLPEQLEEAEITGIVQEVISELQAASKADKGRVMSALMPRFRGRADGKLVSQVVDRMLDGSSV